MATWLDLKTYVTGQLGADDGSTPTSVRDKKINEARREFHSHRRWSFLNKTTTLNFTAKVADLSSDATDYNYKFDPIDVYSYDGTTKTQYAKVAWADVGYFGTDEYVYAIDKAAQQIKINTSDATLTMDYTYLPADKDTATSGDDSDEEPAPDITPIGLLAIAKWWLASERATGKYQLFKDEYRVALAEAILVDASSFAVRPLYPRRVKLKTGYTPRGR